MNVEIKDGTLTSRIGNYVIYDIDYLLDHLSQEIWLLECYRKSPKQLNTVEDIKQVTEKRGD